jgi:hypothetical protein
MHSVQVRVRLALRLLNEATPTIPVFAPTTPVFLFFFLFLPPSFSPSFFFSPLLSLPPSFAVWACLAVSYDRCVGLLKSDVLYIVIEY